ncbi:MAG: hypothetical protein P1V20_09010 [Verrucomicrobiales bacterium]|nr:hypothetical protein [Verrucomicrobiales bacterium]
MKTVFRTLFLSGLLCICTQITHADQFVLCDVTFELTKAEADQTKSHYFVKKDSLSEKTPVDWTSPVDYRNGTLHLRLEVLDKAPGEEKTTWSVCYISAKGHKGGYGCTNTPVYTKPGVSEKTVKMNEFWHNNLVTWTKGIDHISLVMKDSSGGKGHAHNRTDAEKFFPTKVRFVLTQVSAGATYQP